MQIYRISTLARSIDLDYPTNRAIIVLSGVVSTVATVALVLHSGDLPATLWSGLKAGAAVFAAWILGRELDPDHERSAFIAAAIAATGLLLGRFPDFIAVLWLVLTVRAVNRTTGLDATLLDSLGILLLGSWLAFSVGWPYAMVTALAFVFSARSPATAARQRLLALAAAAAAAAALLLTGRSLMPLGAPGLMAALTSLLLLPVIRDSRQMRSVGDRTQETLEGIRVQLGQLTALAAGIMAAATAGAPGLLGLFPLWAAVLGAAIEWAIRGITHPTRSAPAGGASDSGRQPDAPQQPQFRISRQ